MTDNNDEEKQLQHPFMMTDTITKFSGEDLTYSSSKWGQDIDDHAEIFGWTAQQKLIIARRSLTGTAALWLRTEKTFKTFDDLKTALQREFPESVNTKQMHETMSARKKNHQESCYQYMLIMKELGRRAKFPDYVTIQYIIDGIQDNEVNKMCLYGVTNYATLKEKLTIYEAMTQKMKRNSKRDLNVKEHRRASSSSESSSNGVIQRCFKCGDKGHMSRECKNGVKCFRCNSFGHIGAQCNRGEVEATRRAMCIETIEQSPPGGSTPCEVSAERERMNEMQD